MTAATPQPIAGSAQLHGAARLAVLTIAIGAPLILTLLVVMVVLWSPPMNDGWAFSAYTAVVATWSLVGALIVTRRPGNRVGWLILAIGVTVAASLVGQSWGTMSVTQHGGTLPGTTFGAWLQWLFVPALAAALLFVPLLFPDGAPPSPRWRLVGLAAAVAIAMQAIGTILLPGESDMLPGFDNPTGIADLEPIAGLAIDLGGLLLIVCLPLCMLAAVVRFRRGSVVERQQLKWYGAAMGLAGLGLIGATTLPQPLGQACWVGMTIAVGLVPVAIAVAILRYRLFDIDRLISRTLAYAVITALLAFTFLVTNLALQALLAGVTGSSALVTALATLIVAGLFRPLRRRIQGAVDRRFNRRGLDTERAIGGFTSRARDEVDIEHLRAAVVGTASEAVAPAGASLWLRTGPGRP
jgi:MFS family permease